MMSKKLDIVRCPECRTDIGRLVDPWRTVLVNIWDARALNSVVLSDQAGRCSVCGNILDSSPTYVLYDDFAGPNDPVDVLPGWAVENYQLPGLIYAVLKREANLRVYGSIQEFISAIADRVRPEIEMLNEY
ncbi:hypothetical protein [Streptomyces longwoodensis]|uniref:hypothetical protein n=1 Tax=Streptomyces longwoodensis TaxID=68231 RepID=UPI0032532717